MRKRSKLLAIVVFISIAGCSVLSTSHLTALFGPEKVQSRTVTESGIERGSVYWRDVKPVLDRRCVVCHSCYDAPCQLKLTSHLGIDRGATKANVYDPGRLFAASPSRMHIDARNTQEWRGKGFYPVLNERVQTEEANLEASVLYRLMDLKRKNPLPSASILPKDFNFSLDRVNSCPVPEEIDEFEKRNPQAGMPFGLPALDSNEFKLIERWLKQGALAELQPLPPEILAEIDVREQFLNGDSLKEQLVSRYIYEHLYLGNLYFDVAGSSRSFKLVRSSTPPGDSIAPIATRRPTDDPGVARVYYRLQHDEESPVAKSHMPYVLDRYRLERLGSLFLAPHYDVRELPPYDPEIATNPFKAYAAIPLESRYRFMLDDAAFFVMGFMKGPVCRGQTALNVIDDQFWVFFIDPERSRSRKEEQFLARNSNHLALPAESGSSTLGLVNWHRYAEHQKEYLAAKNKALGTLAQQNFKTATNLIWAGDRHSSDAALTVFRNYDSASVVRGLVGLPPKTAWVLNYSLFERIHYLLTVDFDVFGNYGHQLLTRLYFDFLRAEAENNFLSFLPREVRESVHANWYRGIGASRNEYTLESSNFDWAESAIKFQTNTPKEELYRLFAAQMGEALSDEYKLNGRYAENFGRLHELMGPGISFMPETSFVRVKGLSGKDEVFTILLNRAHTNVAIPFLENYRLIPEEDTLTVAPGFIGAYPNTFFVVAAEDLPRFIGAIGKLSSEADYTRLANQFALRRSRPDFWVESDWFQDTFRNTQSARGALLDFSRLENR